MSGAPFDDSLRPTMEVRHAQRPSRAAAKRYGFQYEAFSASGRLQGAQPDTAWFSSPTANGARALRLSKPGLRRRISTRKAARSARSPRSRLAAGRLVARRQR